MKISIAWVFDHIDGDVSRIDVPDLIARFNDTTAEIEGYHKVKVDLDQFSLAHVQAITKKVIVKSAEWGKEIELPLRDDLKADDWYLIVKRDGKYDWARTTDIGGEKDMALPAVTVPVSQQKGGWKKTFESTDYIFTVDNKSITHRPDLWGHRGFAREIAALLHLPLKPLEDFVVNHPIKAYEQHAPADSTAPIGITIENEQACRRFAGLYMPTIEMRSSLLWMATRLARVDSRSINAIVDFTNYVMLDLSQPMHSFDADQLASKSIVIRSALNKETLTLLDDQELELCSQDLLISDGDQPVALAGIMGGKRSGISDTTTTLFLESANFNAATIRKSAQRHKIRTEASARFEKSLDPNQNTDAIVRFLKLLDDADIAYKAADHIASLGPVAQPLKIEVAHLFIEERLGTTIAPSFVVDTLQKLAFEVREEKQDGALVYHITVPTFRSTKDVMIKEDIVEEVGRFYGYSQIPFVLPLVQTKPADNQAVYQAYTIKHLLAYGLSMQELYTYCLFDESFLRTINWDPGKTAQIKDPVSENLQRLVTTLVPHLFKAVQENSVDHDQLRFFEWARCWDINQDIVERKSLSGIFFDKKQPIDFYYAKAQLEQLFAMLKLPVQWHHVDTAPYPWYHASQTAYLMHEGTAVGVAGSVDPLFWRSVAEGHAFVFELNAEFLETYSSPLHRFVQLPKYPEVERDISMLVPLSLTVEELCMIVQKTDDHVVQARLIDMFQKKEWKDHRSVTVRYVMRDATKTMTKAQADTIHNKVVQAVETAGVTIR